MVAVGEKNSEGWFQIMRVIKIVGGRIIDFLDQIEFFQKKLWEKLKFVTETQYCITVERIDEAFYPEIADCEDQWNEWKDLFKLNEEKGAMCSGNLNTKEGRIQILKNNPTLVVDTKYYSQHFSDKLLHNIENLDDITGGVLFNGDNYHVLSLLGTKYNEAVKCIYIDPPFNTENDGFLYKDGYLHSSWLTMMKDRLELAKKLLSNDGTFYAHIDYNEKERLKLLLDTQLVYITEIIWRIGWVSGYKSAAKKFIRNHDTIYQYGKAKSPLFLKTYIQYPEGYTRRDGGEPSGNGYPLEDTWNCNELDQLNSIQIMSFSKEKVGNQALTQKNENLIARMIKSSSNEKDLILDYFLGSGTTTAVAHKLNRKYIGIEMGPQFDTYVLPRMKKVLFGEPYGISSEVSWKGGGVFKYSRVESYEDTLNNIQFDEATGQEVLKFDDYILKYMLKWETKKSETLLNIEKLANPFDYRLGMVEGGKTSEKMVDIPETFNYLLGLHVRTRKVYNNKDQRYLVFRGQIDHREVAVIWRNIEDWTKEDLEKDKKFVIEQQLTEGADEVFVNGDSFIPEAKSLDPIFKARMFAEVQ
jgi:adenine-specific DNA-methyltransferase